MTIGQPYRYLCEGCGVKMTTTREDPQLCEKCRKTGEMTTPGNSGVQAIEGEEMKRLLNWLSSWRTTLHIMIFERETYKILREEGFREDDFTEVSPPERLYTVTLELSDYWWPHVDHVTAGELERFTQAWKSAGFGKDQVNQITLTGKSGSYTAYGTNIFGIHATEEK